MAERVLTVLFVLATLVLAAAWPGWRLAEAPPAYGEEPARLLARAGTQERRPPPGDVVVLARRFEFFPAVELMVGQSYRLHLSAVDGVHSMVLNGREVLLVPGEVRVVDITPDRPGSLDLRCNEYCGLGHSRMRGAITVVEAQD